MYQETWLDKLDRKYGRHAIHSLMTWIIVGMGTVYILDWFVYPILHTSVRAWLAFDRAAILHGQIWRLITFIFVPSGRNLLYVVISMYFYSMIGSSLEREWGAFRFNIFYLCGMLGAILAGFVTGYTTSSYLNLSMFLAFAILYPECEVLVFYILPVKMKFLGILAGAGLIMGFITSPWSGKLALLLALGNLLLFFWGQMKWTVQNARRHYEWKKNYDQNRRM